MRMVAIVDGSKALAISVSAENPLPVVNYAAKELRQHLERATCRRLDIVTETVAAASKLPFRLHVGRSKASQSAEIDVDGVPTNGFCIRTTVGAVFLFGKDDGGEQDEPGTLPSSFELADRTVRAPSLSSSSSEVDRG